MIKTLSSPSSAADLDSLAPLAIPSGMARGSRPYYRAKQMQRWAAELPIGNTTVAAHQMQEMLKSLNSVRYPYRDRLQLHNHLRSVFSELIYAIRHPLRQANIPLDQQQLYRAGLLQELLEGMALGYKQIVSELSSLTRLKEHDNFLLAESIYMAMLYLSQRLIDAYSLYAPEPKHVWSDLNRLYLFAEARNLHTMQVDDPFPDTPLPVRLNIDFVYKRILLLGLAEPYHLMQYEADDMYRLIASLVDSCKMETFSEIVTQGEFVIDLYEGQPPKFLSADQHWQATAPRLIDITQVKRQLNAHLQRLLASNMQSIEFETVSLLERQQRDMLLRLADAWNASLVRKTQRFTLAAQIELSSGLNASHHYISEEHQFTPEMDELKLVSHLETPPNEDSKNTVVATAYKEALEKDRRHATQQYKLNPWWQRNVSPIGIALNCEQAGSNIDVRVGEFVTYRMAEKHLLRWQVGVIRWLKHDFSDNTEGKVNIGIMNLANGAVPIGTKAIRGLGSGTDYFRSLLIPKQVSLHQTRSLIVPALLYDVGSILAVNMKEKLFYAKLTRMMISTRSFTQFDFVVIKKPYEFDFNL